MYLLTVPSLADDIDLKCTVVCEAGVRNSEQMIRV